jgi:hypothetical protein
MCVCGQKAEFLVLNVAVYTQNIVFTEKIEWILYMMNLIRKWWSIRWGLHGRLEDLKNADNVYPFHKVIRTCPRKYVTCRQK